MFHRQCPRNFQFSFSQISTTGQAKDSFSQGKSFFTFPMFWHCLKKNLKPKLGEGLLQNPVRLHNVSDYCAEQIIPLILTASVERLCGFAVLSTLAVSNAYTHSNKNHLKSDILFHCLLLEGVFSHPQKRKQPAQRNPSGIESISAHPYGRIPHRRAPFSWSHVP